MLARACWYWSMPVLNMAEAPLAFSRAARLGRGAMTLGAMPCPASERKKRKKGKKKKTDKRKRKRERMFWKKRGKKTGKETKKGT